MPNYAHAVSARAFPIAYKCHYCGEYNCELSTVTAEVRKQWSLLGTSMEEAQKIAAEKANEESRKKMRTFIHEINDNKKLGYITSAGICSHCRKKQCWGGGKNQDFLLNLYLFVVFLIILVPLIISYDTHNPKVCLFALSALPIIIIRRIILAVGQKKVDTTLDSKDPWCFPIACEIEKADIHSTDNRIRYIAIQRDIVPALIDCYRKSFRT